jgi:hypothetical protein
MARLMPRWQILVGLAVVWLAGCATTVTAPVISPLKIDESLTHETIVAGKMGIGGVVTHVSDSGSAEAGTYARLLRKTFMNERQDFVVLPIEEVRRKIGTDRHETVLQEYARAGRLTGPCLMEAQAVANECRYMIFASIIDNEVNVTCREYTETDWETGSSQGDLWVEVMTTRYMRASMDIYDLVTAVSVFRGTVNISESVSKKYSKTADRNIGERFLRMPVHAFLQTALQPEPPSTEGVLEKLFVTFAKSVP